MTDQQINQTETAQSSLTDAIEETIARWAAAVYYRARAEEGLDDIPAWKKVIRLLRTQDPLAQMAQEQQARMMDVGKGPQDSLTTLLQKYTGQGLSDELLETMTKEAEAWICEFLKDVELPENGKLTEHIGVRIMPVNGKTQVQFIGLTEFGDRILKERMA